MNSTVSVALLWLFVINLGIAAGAGWYELRVVVPAWGSDPPRSFGRPESGLRFWVFVSTGPLTLLTIANAAAAWLASGPARGWWLAAVAIELAERIATFGYFVPTMMRLTRDQAAPSVSVAAFKSWTAWNYVRNIASLIAWIAALQALVIVG